MCFLTLTQTLLLLFVHKLNVARCLHVSSTATYHGARSVTSTWSEKNQTKVLLFFKMHKNKLKSQQLRQWLQPVLGQLVLPVGYYITQRGAGTTHTTCRCDAQSLNFSFFAFISVASALPSNSLSVKRRGRLSDSSFLGLYFVDEV